MALLRILYVGPARVLWVHIAWKKCVLKNYLKVDITRLENDSFNYVSSNEYACFVDPISGYCRSEECSWNNTAMSELLNKSDWLQINVC